MTKMYYFSFAKHAHDLEFRRNRLKNTIDDMLMGEGKPDFDLIEKMEKEISQLEEIMSYWDGYPASKIPAHLYGVAKDAVLWASNARAETCIENGRLDLVQYC